MLLIVKYLLCLYVITAETSEDIRRRKSKQRENKYMTQSKLPKNRQELRDKYINNETIHLNPGYDKETQKIFSFTNLLSRGSTYPYPTSHSYNAWRYKTLATWDIGTDYKQYFKTPLLPAIPYYTHPPPKIKVNVTTTKKKRRIRTKYTKPKKISSVKVSELEAAHSSWRSTYQIPPEITNRHYFIDPWLAAFRAGNFMSVTKTKSQYRKKTFLENDNTLRNKFKPPYEGNIKSHVRAKTSHTDDNNSHQGYKSSVAREKISLAKESSNDKDKTSLDRDKSSEVVDRMSQDRVKRSKVINKTSPDRDKSSETDDRLLQYRDKPSEIRDNISLDIDKSSEDRDKSSQDGDKSSLDRHKTFQNQAKSSQISDVSDEL